MQCASSNTAQLDRSNIEPRGVLLFYVRTANSRRNFGRVMIV